MIDRLLFRSVMIAAIVALAAVGMAGRGSGGDGPAAVMVNGERIPAAELESAAAQAGQPQDAARRLERIVDQALLAQEARRVKLDREPRVAQAIEAATRQILAHAYLERVASARQAEARGEVERFYQENPALFQRRRVYRVLELTVMSPHERLGEIREAAAAAASLDDVAGWLEARQLPFNAATSSRAAEQIPLHVLRDVYAMRQGQIAVFPTPRGASVVQLLRSSEMPLDLQQATPVIERFLLNRKRFEAGLAEVQKLRQRAAIEYGSGFQPTRPGALGPRARPAELIETASRAGDTALAY